MRNPVCRFLQHLLFSMLLLTAWELQAQPSAQEGNTTLHAGVDGAAGQVQASVREQAFTPVDGPAGTEARSRVKCGTGQRLLEVRERLHAAAHGNAPAFRTPRPAARQISRLSPSGRFILHYDTSGYHASAMLDAQGNRLAGSAHEYIDSLAASFDRSWDVQVDVLGYDAPPTEGDGQPYEIFVEESGGSEYGFTMPIEEIGGGTAAETYTTYIQLDNDFREFPTIGLPAAQATAAHEFHHAIQLGRYGSWMDHLYIHEMTSTYMEEVVFPRADDYIEYLSDFMRDPQRSLYTWPGYEAVLWPLRLHILRGPDPWRTVWEGCREQQPMEAMRDAFLAMGSSLGEEYCAFVRDLYNSGYRADATSVFPDAWRYPSLRMSKELVLLDSVRQSGTVPVLGVRYYRVIDGADTLTLSVAAADETLAVERSPVKIGFTLSVRRNSGEPDMTQLPQGWQYRLETSMPSSLCVSAYVETPTGVTEIPSPNAHQLPPYPQPFLPRLHASVSIPLPGDAARGAVVTVHSMDGRLLRTLRTVAGTPPGGNARTVSWDGRDADGRNLASGVYLYTVHQASGRTLHGKLNLIHTAH